MLGTRPMETISRSKAALCALPCASAYSTAASFFAFTPVIRTPSSILSPCLVKIFQASFAICSSAAPRKTGSASRIVTPDPRRRQTLPISRPITPAPITPRRLGTSGISSAPVLLRISFSSKAAPGSSRGFDPVATITSFAVKASFCAPLTATSQPLAPALTKLPRPWKNAILFFLNR